MVTQNSNTKNFFGDLEVARKLDTLGLTFYVFKQVLVTSCLIEDEYLWDIFNMLILSVLR